MREFRSTLALHFQLAKLHPQRSQVREVAIRLESQLDATGLVSQGGEVGELESLTFHPLQLLGIRPAASHGIGEGGIPRRVRGRVAGVHKVLA